MNDTKHPDIVCKPIEEIDDYLENSSVQVNLFYTNTILSPTNHSTLFTRYLDYSLWYLLSGPEVGVRLNQQDIINDDNLLIEDWNPKKLTTFQIDPQEIITRLGKFQTIYGDDSLLDI